MRGFDPDEVKAFMERIADDVDELLKENEELKLQVETLNQQLEEFKKIEKNLQDTLLKAQESSTKSIESAKKQTALMIKEAELKAAQIIEKARESANEIRNAVLNLREEKDMMIARLKAIISSQAHLLEVKIEDIDEEVVVQKKKTKDENKKLDLNIDDIVEKLL
ncbi:Cell division initiation protein [Ignavibacterium album JCM 16511]|uniref:Cell division initiation protein n=2 Tax=Ignavibacterium album TaxID=591197 RepID=I0AGS5_IGNAJ|nr:Cell division initiation protein [Ignavibacterium album JCM 16511]